ncbi:aspartyl protease family protein [Sphingomonas psychrotolerans]|uniref:Aspartyl protease family protein n=1 Tax=Sphingomonas psychrotolerans TaxID=1327635 RepID=A0ABU3N9W7_9SPHN|nr:aspartyl protease family protein [Sphingomonas psychrotolerans]MDT8761111.1 aspartyl protease family protein [Sphingomonas psychrotolerans]
MLALLLPAIAFAAAQTGTTLAPDTEAQWIDFQLTPYNQVRFPIELNGHASWAILDTGLSDTIVTSRFARTAGLTAARRQQALAIGGGVEVAWANAASIRFGGLTRTHSRVGIADPAGGIRFGADILVGADVLSCCALDIDYDTQRFRILPSGRMPFLGSTAPLWRRSPNGVYQSEVAVAGKPLKPIIVDTGDGGALTLSRSAWIATGYRDARITTTLGWGMGGAVVTDTLMIPSLTLAGMPPRETELRIEDEGGFTASVGAAGRLGTGMLRRYRVLLDPRAGRMILQPGGQVAAPFPRSTSGLLVEFTGSALRVVHVMRGSPAEAGGWKAGEQICSADGIPASEDAKDGAIEWTVAEPGRTVRLGLCDGTERNLTLADFY